MRERRNLAASVRARLTERARARGEDVQLVLTRYALERLLYRLSRSEHAGRFVLKGAMLFALWADVPYRATRDLDLLGYGASTPEAMARLFEAICTAPAEADGVTFLPGTVQAEQVREANAYQGVRVTLEAEIARARLTLQVDIGFGDVIVPGSVEIDYPVLLEFPAPRLSAYPPEAVVAEKFQAVVRFGPLMSRMKDLYDLWAIASTFDFEGRVLAGAIGATFERRKTALPAETPPALAPTFAESAERQAQWRGFLRRTEIALTPEPLPAVLGKLRDFLLPPTEALVGRMTFDRHWPAGGPWTPA